MSQGCAVASCRMAFFKRIYLRALSFFCLSNILDLFDQNSALQLSFSILYWSLQLSQIQFYFSALFSKLFFWLKLQNTALKAVAISTENEKLMDSF